MASSPKLRPGAILFLVLSNVLFFSTVQPGAFARSSQPTTQSVMTGSAVADSVINLKQWKAADGGIACVNGDVNGSETVTAADVICVLDYVFKGGPYCLPGPCIFAGDVNCTGALTTADVIYLVNFIFKGGVPPCNSCANCGL